MKCRFCGKENGVQCPRCKKWWAGIQCEVYFGDRTVCPDCMKQRFIYTNTKGDNNGNKHY